MASLVDYRRISNIVMIPNRPARILAISLADRFQFVFRYHPLNILTDGVGFARPLFED